MINKAIKMCGYCNDTYDCRIKTFKSRMCTKYILSYCLWSQFSFIQMDGLYYGLLQTRCGSGLDLVFVSFVISLLCMEIISLGLACLLSADENQHGVKNTKPKNEIQSIIHSVRSARSIWVYKITSRTYSLIQLTFIKTDCRCHLYERLERLNKMYFTVP